jgi:hypothetical protein
MTAPRRIAQPDQVRQLRRSTDSYPRSRTLAQRMGHGSAEST